MQGKVKVICENTSSHLEIEMGTPLLDLIEMFGIKNELPFLAAYVNNRLKELNYQIFKPMTVRFIDITHFEGYRVYQRTISFILQKAVRDIYSDRKLYIRHSLGRGLYYEFADGEQLTDAGLVALRERMQSIIAARYPIMRHRMLTSEVEEIYKEYGYDDKIVLLNTRPRLYSDLYRMDDVVGYFYGALAPDSGYIHLFDIKRYDEGFYVALPTRLDPSKLDMNVHWDKMLDVFSEYHDWVQIMGVPTVGHLNEKLLNGDMSELIKVAEAFHEKKIAGIADQIYAANKEHGTRVVLISGPSSSGKTTTSKRLGIQLRILGLDPVLISLDDYFVDRDRTPKDENGEYDFEALEAIDLELLNKDLKRLMDGESVEVPRYDFITGSRKWHDNPLKLGEHSVIIMEGIHALNPRLTPSIPREHKFGIYASCLTSVAMDNLTRIQTTDNRLLRRITRDYATRGANALATLQRWPSVRRGEEKHIFPYQENADVIFNTSLFYEILVLRPKIEPILREVPDTEPEYGEARRLLQFLDNFTPLYTDEIPPTSILREFVGGSTFKY
ncbi:MAG: nucleoside kinase [Rikenellaceae bacterium]|nr:nucleoside kinase [Rikenellaceae bacterium]MBO7343687.1 nucleoside kinase [Alistipes sp.]